MSSVYSGSKGIIAYLGEESFEDGSQHIATVFDTVFDVATEWFNSGSSQSTYAPLGDRSAWGIGQLAFHRLKRILHLSDEEDISSTMISWIKKFFARPWFRRVWVVQEVRPACEDISMVLCVVGPQRIKWANVVLVRALAVVLGCGSQMDDTLNYDAPVLYGVARLDMDLMELLEQSQRMKASDPRDHCFGILAISRYAEEIDLQPDYGEFVTDTFLRYARFLVNKGQGPRMLTCCVKIPGKSLGLPSWIPNWSSRVPSYPSDEPVQYLAGSQVKGKCRILNDKTLVASSFILGQIIATGICDERLLSEQTSRKPNIEQLDDNINSTLRLLWGVHNTLVLLLRSASRRGVTLRTHLSFQQVARFLLNDTMGPTMERIKTNLPWAQPLLDAVHDWNKEGLAEILKDSEVVRAVQSMAGQTIDTHMSITRDGYLVKLPPIAQNGDRIAIVLGCPLPLLLRQVLDHNEDLDAVDVSSKTAFEIVGYAYVHGIMDGEAVAEHADHIQDLIFI